jgi:hypothetical protein
MAPKGVLEKMKRGVKTTFPSPILDNFFSMLGSAIQFYQKFDFGGNIVFFRFLGFFPKKTKNLKNAFWGAKMKKSKI